MKRMKKAIVFICVMALLLSTVWVPMSVAAFDLPMDLFEAKDDYKFFGFEEGQVVPADADTTATDSVGDTFYVVRSGSVASKTEQATIAVKDNGTTFQRGTLKISSYSDPTCVVITDENGKPFEAKANTTYSLRMKGYVGMFGKYAQCFFGIGTYKADSKGYPSSTEFTDCSRMTYSAADGYGMATKTKAAKYPTYDIGSAFYQDWGLNTKSDTSETNNCRYYADFSTDNKYQCYTETAQLTTGDFLVHTSSGTEASVKPYLCVYFSGSSLVINGETVPCSIYLDYIEIYETANYSQATVNFYDGDTLLETKTTAVGNAVPAVTAPAGKVFGGWYLDAACTLPYGEEKVDRMNLNLYGRFLNAEDTVSVKYYAGDELLLSRETMVTGALWDGKGGVNDCAFAGWYTDKALTQLYTSSNAGVTDLELYGKYVPYTKNVTLSNWKTRPDKLSVYTVSGNKIVTEFAAGGWNYNDVTSIERPNGELTLGNRQTWVQGGGVLLYDPDTEALLLPAPSTTYEVTVKYTVPSMDATSATLYFGYGVNKSYEKGMNGNGASMSTQIATTTEPVTEVQTVTTLLTVPEDVDPNVLPCFVFSASFGGRKDASNEKPVSYFAIQEVTLKIKSVEGLSYGGVSILTDEAASTYNTQGMRVYYNYTLNENGKISDGANEYAITERGVIMRAASGSFTNLTLDNVGKGGVRGVHSYIKDLDNCWNYDEASRTVTFSACLSGLAVNDDRRVMFRGYIVLDDGTVCYTDVATVSVQDVQCIRDINKPLPAGQKEKLAIMLVIGQSNAQGAGYSEELGIVEASGGLWQLSALPTVAEYGDVFMSKTGAVTSLSPSNEYSVNYRSDTGGYAPALAAQWHELTGERVVILQLAVGATGLAEWQKDANTKGIYKELQYNSGDRGFSSDYYLYRRAAEAFNATYEALKDNFDIEHTFYVWNQGENAERRTDPNASTIYDDETYAYYYNKMHEDFMNDCPGLQAGSIIVVRSCDPSSTSNNRYNSGASTNARRAQYRLCAERDDLFMISWYTEECNNKTDFSSKGITTETWGGQWDLVPSCKGCSYMYSNMHFTQLNYNIMGKEGADNLYALLEGKKNFTGVGLRDGDNGLIGTFGSDGSGSFTVTNTGKSDTRYLQIRTEDPTSDYDFALHYNPTTQTVSIDVYTDGSHPASGDAYISRFGQLNWDAIGTASVTVVCNIH